MTEVIATRGNLELLALDKSWAPWKAQVNRVEDGAAYGRPGARIRTSMANFETIEAARAAFNR